MKRISIVALALCAFVVPLTEGQRKENFERGFSPEKKYQLSNLDHVNLFNGNLVITIPIGGEYPLGGGSSYALTLAYNAQIWEFSEVTPIPPPESGSNGTCCEAWSYPNGRSNAGIGWMLSLGRRTPVYRGGYRPSPGLPDDDDISMYAFESPDGNDHRLDSTIHDQKVSTDGSYLRWNDTTETLESPDGAKTTFWPDGYLKRKEDAFGNFVAVDETNDADGLLESWHITDSHNRSHWVYFRRFTPTSTGAAHGGTPSLPNYKIVVDRVVLQTAGGPTTYRFVYADDGGNVNSLTTVNGNEHGWVEGYPNQWSLPLLRRVELPDGSSYRDMKYVTATTPGALGAADDGLMTGVTLPTGGKMAWEYGKWTFTPDDCEAARRTTWRNVTTGVRVRRLADASGAELASWSYRNGFEDIPATSQRCGVEGGASWFLTIPESIVTTVTSPSGLTQKHWSNGWNAADTPPSGATGGTYGEPQSRAHKDATGTRYLSSKSFACPAGVCPSDAVPLRQQFTRHVTNGSPANLTVPGSGPYPRVESERTVYEDSSYVDTDRSEFDGFGHFRKEVVSGTGTETRTSYTNFNPGTNATGYRGGVYAFGPTDRWLLGTYTYQQVTQGSSTLKSVSCFDRSTGFLKSVRTLKNNVAAAGPVPLSADDVLSVFTPDTTGNVLKEQYYGGDPSDMANGGSGGNLPTSGEPCTQPLPPSPTYEIRNLFANGNLATSRHFDPRTSTLLPFKSIDRIVHSSGSVIADIDTTGVVRTDYLYDAAGRLSKIVPAGEAPTTHSFTNASYAPASGLMRATAAVSRGDTSLGYQFDDLGRVAVETRAVPGTGDARRVTSYDGEGRVASVSEWSSSAAPMAKTTFTYDVFGRKLTTTLPDGSRHRTAYVGTRQVERYVQDPGASAETLQARETYDALGQLLKVEEKPSGSAVVLTAYGYDAGGRLISVTMNGPDGNGASAVQNRSFEYDGRGFLRSEGHPEAGQTSYTHDARGNTLTKRLGAGGSPFDLNYSYDAAGRLIRVEGRNPHFDPQAPHDPEQPRFRVMRTFDYGTANASGDARNGKLVNAARYNYDPAAKDGTIYKVAETYAYGDTAGRLTSRRTTITKGFGGKESAWNVYKTIEMAVVHDQLSHPIEITYPMCWDCGAPSNGPWRDQRTTYVQGRAKTVGGFLSDIAYWPNGMWKTMLRSNGMTDQQTVDASGIARPAEISSRYSTACAPPRIGSQPEGGSISTSTPSVTLTVSAMGTGPFSYAWRQGISSAIIGTGPSFVASPGATTQYSVSVTNACGTAQSVTATVTVGECIPPDGSISSVELDSGEYRLSVTASGSEPRTYEWRRLPDPAIIGIKHTLTVAPITGMTTYSVTIANDCVGSTPVTRTYAITVVPLVSGVTATKTSNTQVRVQWTGGASAYDVERRSDASGWRRIAQVTGTSYDDTGLQPGQTYAYRVRVGSYISNADVATTGTFAPAVVGANISSASFDAALASVNSVRAAFGWPALTWSTIMPSALEPGPNKPVSMIHLVVCRARMDEALASLGVITVPWIIDPDPEARRTTIKAAQVNEIIGRAY